MTPKEWAIAHVGDGYIYGARGQKCSLAFREQQAKQYPAQAEMILGTGAKWDGKTVWDCAQFTRYAWKQAGVELCSGATSQWKKTNWSESGTIDKIPECVCSVFREKNGTMQHSGLYIGDGVVIEAKGTKYGVVKTALSAGNWTHFGVPNNQSSEGYSMAVNHTATVVAYNGFPVKMRDSDSSDGAVICKVPCGSTVDVYFDASGWSQIAYNGQKGYMMSKFLTEEPQKDTEGAESDSGLYLYEKMAEHEKRIEELQRKIIELLDAEG